MSLEPPDRGARALSARALLLGLALAAVLAASNTYLALRVGLTASGMFPAAVVAFAVLRPSRRRPDDSVGEQNAARATGSVGEALAAGAAFTLPALLFSAVWTRFDGVLAWALILSGGVLGLLITILLRRPLVSDPTRPFPESVAGCEIVRAGQREGGGGRHLFRGIGLAALIEFLRNSQGVPLLGQQFHRAFNVAGKWFAYQLPGFAPGVLGLGFLIGPRTAASLVAGGILGWFLFLPLVLEIHPPAASSDFGGAADSAYRNYVRPFAVGVMLAAAVFTLFRLRTPLVEGIRNSLAGFRQAIRGGATPEQDLSRASLLGGAGAALVLVWFVLWWQGASPLVATLLVLGLAAACFLFSAASAYLVSLYGSSANPISGLAMSALLLTAALFTLTGLTGEVALALMLTCVLCCLAGVAGNVIQEWKVGHLLRLTPAPMQAGGILGVVSASIAIAATMQLLVPRLGSPEFGAPQARAIADIARGLKDGGYWAPLLVGAALGAALLLMGAHSPMGVAVGMYLPLEITTTIFAGGLLRAILEVAASRIARSQSWSSEPPATSRDPASDPAPSGEPDPSSRAEVNRFRAEVENRAVLSASGLIAGEALIGIVLAATIGLNVRLFAPSGDVEQLRQGGQTVLFQQPDWFGTYGAGLVAAAVLAVYLVVGPLRGARGRNTTAVAAAPPST